MTMRVARGVDLGLRGRFADVIVGRQVCRWHLCWSRRFRDGGQLCRGEWSALDRGEVCRGSVSSQVRGGKFQGPSRMAPTRTGNRNFSMTFRHPVRLRVENGTDRTGNRNAGLRCGFLEGVTTVENGTDPHRE